MNPTNPACEKYYSLQILRALAAWMVVCHHFMQAFFSFRSYNPVGDFFSFYGNFGIDLFFVLSGFVMFFSAQNPGQTSVNFLADRLFRIVPAYWFYTALVMLFMLLIPNEFKFTGYDLTTLFYSLFFFPHGNPSGIGLFPLLTVGWTLNFEMFFYITLGLCLLFGRRHALLLCFIIILMLPIVYPNHTAYYQIASSKLLYAFLAGMTVAFLYTEARFSNYVKQHRLIVLGGLLIFAVVIAPYIRIFEIKIILAATIIFIAILFEPYIRHHLFTFKPLVYLGNISYSSYLAHSIVIAVVIHFIGPRPTGISLLVAAVLVAAGTIAMSAATSIYVERNSFLQRVKNKIKTAEKPPCA